nr:transposase family protein [Streptomyces sp. BPSDS2]
MHPRRGVIHDLLACWFGVDCSTATRAIGEVRPLFAGRGHHQPRCAAANRGRGR